MPDCYLRVTENAYVSFHGINWQSGINPKWFLVLIHSLAMSLLCAVQFDNNMPTLNQLIAFKWTRITGKTLKEPISDQNPNVRFYLVCSKGHLPEGETHLDGYTPLVQWLPSSHSKRTLIFISQLPLCLACISISCNHYSGKSMFSVILATLLRIF